MKSQLIVLDFGSQYTQLIARTVRELGVYCEILPGNSSYEKIKARDPKALILSGGPASVSNKDAPRIPSKLLAEDIPVFAICYGMQLVAVELGGLVGGWGRDAVSDEAMEDYAETVENMGEFGPAELEIVKPLGPFSCFHKNERINVWMSHGDKVTDLPQGFQVIATSDGSPVAAFANEDQRIYGVQFHPEVHHTPRGKEILSAFLFKVAKLKKDWDTSCFATETIESIKQKVPSGEVICALSGGVDSTVAAVLVHRAIGDRLHCIFVDNGLLRLNEGDEVMESFKNFGLNVKKVDASELFLHELRAVKDPEEKRKIIGRLFIEIFEEEAQQLKDVQYLVQGTLYPDVIESISVVGKSATIKSHHNVGGLIDDMKLDLIEPLRELFKDEVRAIGRGLGIADSFIERQPFPGPGLAVRCVGEITPERLERLRQADKIVREEVHAAGLATSIWQFFAVLLPVYSVGVMGDGRTFEETIAIRAITSRDGMTADWYFFSEELLRRMSSRIVNETAGINRVVLDVSSKPPATIEWE